MRKATIFDYPYILSHLQRALRELKDADVIKASQVAERAAANIANGRRGIVCDRQELQQFADEMLRKKWGSHLPR